MTDYIEGLCEIGGEVYIVGGATRDYIYNHLHGTNKKIKDFDYVVRLLDAETIIETLKKFGIVKEVGKAFGVILFTPYTSEDSIEFALPRTEISTGTGYRDFIVTPDHNLSLIDDFSRRDATINSIGYRVYTKDDLQLFNVKTSHEPDFEKFIDPYNGLDDIKRKIWRCVGDPSKRFAEDPNRIMRAFRQSAELDLTIEEHTLESIKMNYELINSLIPESYVRLFNELLRIVKSDVSGFYLNMMKDLNILSFLGIKNANILSIDKNTSLVTKFAALISPEKMEENMKEWTNLRQISATDYFCTFDTNTLVAIQQYYDKLIATTSVYDVLKICELMYRTFGINTFYALKAIVAYINVLGKYPKLVEDTKAVMNYPYSTNQLELNGNVLMTKWGIKGTEIKIVKEALLDLIFRDELINDYDVLERYCELHISDILKDSHPLIKTI